MDISSKKINYIIASHAQAYKYRQKMDRYAKYALRYNIYILSKLLKAGSNIAQVTIIAPDVPDDTGYYNLSPYDTIIREKGIKFEIIPVSNEGISYTQYIKCFQKYNDDFDYHLIMEDDWTINLKYEDFDKTLLELYSRSFPTNIGFLDCWSPRSGIFCSGGKGFMGHGFHSAITLGLLSKETINTLLTNLNNIILDQLPFSLEITKRNIPICDLTFSGFPTRIIFWQTHAGVIKDYTTPATTIEPFYVPVQYYYDNVIYIHVETKRQYTIMNSFNIHDV